MEPRYRINLDRRSGRDRRAYGGLQMRRPFSPIRRKVLRRRDDRKSLYYVDEYNPRLVIPILLILLLSMLDAFFTLVLIDNGAVEINPLMAFYLEVGPGVFLTVKYVLTCLSLFVLLMFSHRAAQSMKMESIKIFSFIIVAFTGVVVWQLYLISRIGF
ncbi:MAG TPA: DUF5658 family protein [Desulfobacterales bacterium]